MTFENDPTQQQHTGAPTTYADGAATPAPPVPPVNTTSVLAIVAFVAAFFVGLAGVICGIISLTQLKRTGQKGRGFAIAGIVIGGVQMVTAVLVSFVMVAAAALGAVTSAAESSGRFGDELNETTSSQCAQLGDDFAAAVAVMKDVSSTYASDPKGAVAAVSDAVAQFEASAAQTTDSAVAVAADDVADEMNDMLAYLKLIEVTSTPQGPDVEYRFLQHFTDVAQAFDGLQKACA
jgi:hypothetical protein